MRIVGGIFKGRKLFEFKGYAVRPTSDMTRESLFNILNTKIANKSFLDLFCGTGAVGLEALSRGARKVTLNDVDKESVLLTRKNAEKLGADVTISKMDALAFISYTSEKYDFIFIDAPYQDQVGVDALNKVHEILADGGIVIFENEYKFTDNAEGLTLYDNRKYGRAHLAFFRKNEE